VSRAEAFFHQLANLLVGGTGLIYAWMLHFVESEEEFSLWNHPWQGTVHDLHLLTAPLLLLSIGMLWTSHARPRLRSGQKVNRSSGVALLVNALPMALSGVLLQVAVDEGWRQAWKWVHLATSLLWVAAYLLHQLRSWKFKHRPAAARARR